MGGCVVGGSHEVVAKGYVLTKTAKWHSLVPFSPPYTLYYTKQPNPWPNSSASCAVNYSQLFACQGIWNHLQVTQALVDVWQTSETSHSKSSLGNVQHQYLAELLVNVYSYCLMVKSVSCYCVHGSRLFSNPVTYIISQYLYMTLQWFFEILDIMWFIHSILWLGGDQ